MVSQKKLSFFTRKTFRFSTDDHRKFLVIGGGLKKGKHRTVQLIDMDKGTYHAGKLLILDFFYKV